MPYNAEASLSHGIVNGKFHSMSLVDSYLHLAGAFPFPTVRVTRRTVRFAASGWDTEDAETSQTSTSRNWAPRMIGDTALPSNARDTKSNPPYRPWNGSIPPLMPHAASRRESTLH